MITDLQSKIVQTIMLRPGQRSCIDYINAFHQQGIRIGTIVRNLLSHKNLACVSHGSQKRLVIVTNTDIGCTDCYTLEETMLHSAGSGILENCDLEAVLQFRLEYMNQPMNERLIVCTEPLKHPDGGFHLLSVEHDQYGLWLYSYPYNTKDLRNGLNKFLWQLNL